MKKLFISLFLLTTFITHTYAQGPSIVAGAGKVLYNKGELDADVIIQIISTKREEVKSELANRLMLDKLTDGSFAFYHYAEKNLHVLMNNSETKVISKELLRNSTELALVHGIVEAYLADIIQQEKVAKLSLEEQTFLEFLKTKEYINPKVSLDTASTKSNYNSFTLIDEFKSSNVYGYNLTGFRSQKTFKPEFIFALVDLVFDICKNNQEVRTTGLFQSQNYSIEKYNALNKYLVSQFVNPDDYKALQGIREKLDELITSFFVHYNSLTEGNINMLKSAILKNDSIILNNDTILFKSQVIFDNEPLISKIREQTYQMKGCISAGNCENELLGSVVEDLLMISKVNKGTNISTLSKIRYSIEHDILPAIVLNSSIENSHGILVSDLFQLCGEIEKVELDSLARDTSFSRHSSNLENYLPIFQLIRNLDDAHTYDRILKVVTQIVDVYGDQQAKAVVEAITTAIDRYSIINGAENSVTIDVETLALDLYTKFGDKQRNRFNAMLNVGINYMGKMNKDAYTFVAGSDTVSFNQNSFISEKIGVRVNLFDWNRKRAFGDYNFGTDAIKNQRRATKIGAEPLVNNLHLQVYGSGLLYQIKALNSEDKFTKPLAGVGLGLTFFNGLDFSVNYTTPDVNPDKLKDGFICLAFDVDISEYLSAARSKQK